MKKPNKKEIENWKIGFINQNQFDKIKSYCVAVHNADPRLFDSGSFRQNFNALKQERENRIKKDSKRENKMTISEAKRTLDEVITNKTKKLNININTIATTYLNSLGTIANVVDEISEHYRNKNIDYMMVLNMLPKIEIANRITKEGLEVLKQFINGDGEVEIDEKGKLKGNGISKNGDGYVGGYVGVGSGGRTNQTNNQLVISVVEPIKSKGQ